MEADLERARGLQQQGDVDRAAAIYQQILAEQPDHHEARHLLAVADIQRQDPVSAIDRLEALVADVPGEARYQNNLGNAYAQVGDQSAAAAAFDKAAALEPDNADYRANAASGRLAMGDGEAAEQLFRAALALAPEHFRSLHNLGALLARSDRFAEALPYLEQAAAHAEGLEETRLNLATVYERLNRLNEAEQTLAPLQGSTHPLAALLTARLRRRRGDAAGAVAALANWPGDADSFADAGLRGEWLHETALAADLNGEHQRAFESLLAAKANWRRQDGSRDGSAYITAARDWRRRQWTRAASAPATGGQPRTAFFVGFPRSGTALMQAILDAHPGTRAGSDDELLVRAAERAVAVTGPVDAAAMSAVQDVYYQALAGQPDSVPADAVLIDKLPLNLNYVRVIDAFFPQARLLVALRDPRDVILGCLMQYFARNPAMRCFDNLDEAVTLYEEVMGLWLDARGELSVPWLEYRYEDLQADQQGTVARVLEFLELPWDAAIEQFGETAAAPQIATPSARGVGRWRNYRAELAPVLPRLAPFVRALGYASDDD